MDSYEIRIHYAANNLVKEDIRWKQIAQGVAAFKPTRMLRLSDTIVDSNMVETRIPQHESRTPGSVQSIITLSGSDGTSQPPPSNIESPAALHRLRPLRSKRKANAAFEKPSLNLAKRTRQGFPAFSEKNTNPVSHDPIASYLRVRKFTGGLQTPDPRETSGKTVLVPVTTSSKYQRVLSDAGCMARGSTRSPLFDPLTSGFVHETSFSNKSLQLDESFEVTMPLHSFRSAEHCTFGTPRHLGNQNFQRSGHEMLRKLSHNQRDTSTPMDCGNLPEHRLEMGTLALSSKQNKDLFEDQDIAGSWTPDAATATPSSSDHYPTLSSPLEQKKSSDRDLVIDLTSLTDDNSCELAQCDLSGPMISPTEKFKFGSSLSECSPRVEDIEILSLPRRVMCDPNYTARSRPFESFIPRNLSRLADKFHLIDMFRPASAPLSIRNTERGYWNMHIRVTDIASVAKTRRPPLTSSQWSDKRFMMRQEGLWSATASTSDGNNALWEVMYPNLDPEMYTAWTAAEFVDFWTRLTRTIERGRAGYDVRATFKHKKIHSTELRLDVRLFGYAETLSHLWIVLYGISNGLTASMPLQWHIPGAGPIITMSGQRKHGAFPGRWIPRRRGVDGSWEWEETRRAHTSTTGTESL